MRLKTHYYQLLPQMRQASLQFLSFMLMTMFLMLKMLSQVLEFYQYNFIIYHSDLPYLFYLFLHSMYEVNLKGFTSLFSSRIAGSSLQCS